MNTRDLKVRREIAKFTLGNVSEKLSDSKLKAIIGGYDGDYPPCWSYCYDNSGNKTLPVWGDCKSAWSQCFEAGWGLCSCGCM